MNFNFDLIYKENKRYCRYILYRRGLIDNALFDDLYQEAMITLYVNSLKPGFILTVKLSTYITSIIFNLFNKELNKNRGLVDISESHDVLSHIIEYDEPDSKLNALYKSIPKLSQGHQEVLNLYLAEHSTDYMVEHLNLSNKDVLKSKKSKAVNNLKKIMFDISK